MPLSVIELAKAKEAIASVLEEVGLEAYVFDLKLQDRPWELHVDCAAAGGWLSLSIPVEVDQLLASRDNDTVRTQLLHDWKKRLSDCKRAGQSDRKKADKG
jgi:hypothetical protein